MKNLRLSHTTKKIFFGLIFLIIFWLLGVVVHFFNQTNLLIAHYFGFIVFGVALFYTLYEFMQHLETTKVASLLLILASIHWFLNPISNFLLNTTFLRSSSLFSDHNFLSLFIRASFFDSNRIFTSTIRIFFLLFSILFLWKQSILGQRFTGLLSISLAIFGMVNFWTLLHFLIIFNLPLFFLLTFSVMVCDTVAFFIGRLFGKRLFHWGFSRFSPNKTWEGVLGGVFAGTLTLFLGFWYFIFPSIPLFFAVILIITMPIFSVLGDLLFSWIKRRISINDFSNLIPEHGGLNDRFDSSYLAFLVFSIIFCFI